MAHIISLSSFFCLGTAVLVAAVFVAPASAAFATFTPGLDSGGTDCGYNGGFSGAYFNNGLTASVLDSQFNGDAGCGTCYSVTCTNHQTCIKGSAVTVVALSRSGGGDDLVLSSAAIDAIVSDQNAGRVEIQWEPVDCTKNGGIAVITDAGCQVEWFAIMVAGSAGNGGVQLLELSNDGVSTWTGMSRNGERAVWVLQNSRDFLNVGRALSVRVTAGDGNQAVLADVIPPDWSPSQTYQSDTNF